MQFSPPHATGTLIKRYKRFLSDIDTGDQQITAHCPNSGSMLSLLDSTSIPVAVSYDDNPKRKLSHTLEMVYVGDTWVSVHTGRTNHVVKEAIQNAQIPSLTGYADIRTEVKYGQQNSRIDILLQNGTKPDAYVEVKNVTMMRQKGVAEFPDGVTARGKKHLQELAEMVKQGHRGVMVYVIARDDATSFAIAKDIDPAYDAAFTQAQQQGVEIIVMDCTVSPQELTARKIIQER